jgi:hypothetical protein
MSAATEKGVQGAIRWCFVASALLIAPGAYARGAVAQAATTTISVNKDEVASTPINFELFRTGPGGVGQWTIVLDSTAIAGVALEQSSSDATENRYPIAIYKRLSLKNVDSRARFKIVSGSMRDAGVIVRFVDPDNYYVVSASALEGRIDLFRMVGGKLARIAGCEADVIQDHWHLLGVVANGEQFEIWLENEWLFTASDRILLVDGRVGLWTEEDNTTRFDWFQIRSLPWSEKH